MWENNNNKFREQIKPHLNALYRLAFRFCNNEIDAEDLVQDLLIKLYEKQTDLASLENARTWLAKSLYHQFIDYVRKLNKTPSTPGNVDPDEELVEIPDMSDIPEQALESMLTQEKILRALDRLNLDQRSLVIMHDMEGYTFSELEHILSTPVGTLKSRLHRARQQLRQNIFMEPINETDRV
jgi:RNA polymerase sigma-70 factor (ECF subfamily)